jgi:hypothetical protein
MNGLTFAPILLFMMFSYVLLGLRRRTHIRRTTSLSTAMTASALGLLFVLLIGQSSSLTPWMRAEIAFMLIVCPWISELVERIPSQRKRLEPAATVQNPTNQKAIVIVELGTLIGHGIVVAGGLIVTGRQLLYGGLASRLRVHGWNGFADAELFKIEPGCDLIVLRCLDNIGMPVPPLPLAESSEDLHEDDSVVHLAYANPQLRRPTLRERRGAILSKAGSGVIAVDLEFEPGHLGSPVLNGHGRLIGIVSGGNDTKSLIIPVEEIQRLLID